MASLRNTINIGDLSTEFHFGLYILVPEITVQIATNSTNIPWCRVGWLNIYDSLIDERGKVLINSYRLFANQSKLIITNIPTEAYSLGFSATRNVRKAYWNLQLKLWY